MNSQEIKPATKNNILDYFGTVSQPESSVKNNRKLNNLEVNKHGGNSGKKYGKNSSNSKYAKSKARLFPSSAPKVSVDDSYTLVNNDPIFSPIKYLSTDVEGINTGIVNKIQQCKPLESNATFELMRKQSNELLGIVREQSTVIEKLLNSVIVNNTNINSVLTRSNEMGEVIEGLRKSNYGHSDMIDKLKTKSENVSENNRSLSIRIEKLETLQESKAMSSKLNLIPLCKQEMESIEKGNDSHKHALQNILNILKIKCDYNQIHSVRIRDGMRNIEGEKRFIKMLLVEFLNDKTAGKVFAQIVAHNSELVKDGKQPRYFAELPTGRKSGLLRFLCNKLKADGHISKIFINEYGLSVQCPIENKNGSGKTTKSFQITCEDDINKLRKTLKLKDADIPIGDVYNLNDRPAKRLRKTNPHDDDDYDDSQVIHENKKTLIESINSSNASSFEESIEMKSLENFSTPNPQ
ncbi:hypothetical protein PVAND_014707 [Polypedilum vanderplanki]|uniref:Uncharacterized protein n=1 Tax=Polypedilum vanderplanki TaxID=319348 RepID=A0A9J6BA52_POLVA|nr:hypothetical protein PVAND_014707 [Polypedilum vanderplanki]